MINDFLHLVIQFAFVVIAVITIKDYFNHRDSPHRDTALLFLSFALTSTLRFAHTLSREPIFSQLDGLAFIVHPYLLVRVVGYFVKVPRMLYWGALIGMLVSWVVVLLGIVEPLFNTTMVTVIYVVIVDGYVMMLLSQKALASSAIVKYRIRFMGIGSGLLALVLVCVGAIFVFPEIESLLMFLGYFAGLFSAFSFYLGLAPPQWLRQLWQLQELRKFLTRLTNKQTPENVDTVYKVLMRAAHSITDAKTLSVLSNDSESGSWTLYQLDKPNIALNEGVEATIAPYYAIKHAQAVDVNQVERQLLEQLQYDEVLALYIVPLIYTGEARDLLIVGLQARPLFADDDVELLSLFAEHSCRSIENIQLVNRLHHQAKELEARVEVRTVELMRRNTYIHLLHRITQAANESTTIDEPLETAIRFVCQALDLNVGHVFAPTENDLSTLESSSIWYLDPPEKYLPFRDFALNSILDTETNLISQAIQKTMPQWYTHINERKDFVRADVAHDVGLKTGIFVPILIQDSTVAVMEFYTDKLLEPDRDVLEIMLQIGTQLGRIIERKQTEQVMQQLNVELEQRVEERTTHLVAVNKELEAFSYSVSHDLRAPLRAIDGFSQALLEDYEDIVDEMGREFLRRIRSESQRMGQLIDDLIGLSRLTRTSMNVKIINLSDMVCKLLDDKHAKSPEREVDFSIQPDLMVCADEALLQVAIQNLIDNAWKFTSKKKFARIEFGCETHHATTEYYLRDNGAGFDMAYVDKLFGAFQRLHSMEEFEGTGIGLATVQRIIHRHGGKVYAEGTINRGATFYFTLGNHNCE